MPARTRLVIPEVPGGQHDFALVGVAAVVTLDEGEQVQRLLAWCSSALAMDRCEAHQAARLSWGPAPTQKPSVLRQRLLARRMLIPAADINATSGYRRQLVKVLGRRALDRGFRAGWRCYER